MNEQVFKVFACCKVVKGASRSLICDLQKGTFDPIPNILAYLLEKYEGKNLESIRRDFKKEEQAFIDQYFNYLEENDYIFFIDQDEVEDYPALNLTWQSPRRITNTIIDVSKESIARLDYSKIVRELDQLACEALEIRAYEKLEINELERLLNHFYQSRLRHIDLIIMYNDNISVTDFESLFNKYQRIHFITIHSAKKDKVVELIPDAAYLIYSTTKVDSEKCCGTITTGDFMSNTSLFTEAQNHNTCLNRKISIDRIGNIKNCPSMPSCYGNIQNTTLLDALEHPDFKRYWDIKKDEIEGCRDCEFRYVCTDCRAYIEDPKNIYSKPLKCGYDPYINKWEEWSNNPLKQKAIEQYQLITATFQKYSHISKAS